MRIHHSQRLRITLSQKAAYTFDHDAQASLTSTLHVGTITRLCHHALYRHRPNNHHFACHRFVRLDPFHPRARMAQHHYEVRPYPLLLPLPAPDTRHCCIMAHTSHNLGREAHPSSSDAARFGIQRGRVGGRTTLPRTTQCQNQLSRPPSPPGGGRSGSRMVGSD